MTQTRDKWIVGMIIGIMIINGVGDYILQKKISALESQIIELEDQLNDQQDLTEFQQEVLYYQIQGVVLEYVHWAFNGTIGHIVETMIYYPDFFSEVYPNRTVSIIQVTKMEFREEIFRILNRHGRFVGSVTVNFPEETLYLIKYGQWKAGQVDVQLLWWSPRSEG